MLGMRHNGSSGAVPWLYECIMCLPASAPRWLFAGGGRRARLLVCSLMSVCSAFTVQMLHFHSADVRLSQHGCYIVTTAMWSFHTFSVRRCEGNGASRLVWKGRACMLYETMLSLYIIWYNIFLIQLSIVFPVFRPKWHDLFRLCYKMFAKALQWKLFLDVGQKEKGFGADFHSFVFML